METDESEKLEQENKSAILRIKKELKKKNLKYEDLTDRNKKVLIAADKFLESQKDLLKKTLNEYIKTSFSIEDFCKQFSISRSTIYKKNNTGARMYDPVIQYINSVGSRYEKEKRNLLTNYLKTIDEDSQLMDKLLSHEVDYMEAQLKLDSYKQELEDARKQLLELRSKLNNTLN